MSQEIEKSPIIISNKEYESRYTFDALINKNNINKGVIRKTNFTLRKTKF